MLIPARLKQNDEIRIIAPSRTLDCVGGFAANQTAQEKLTQLGFKVTFGNHVSGMTLDGTNSISERIDDIHAAFSDPNVKAIQTVIGGFTSNELLPYLDFDLIANNPKIICGFSDFTALANAITAKTGLVTYYGPAYITLKMLDKAGAYQDNAFMQALTQKHYELRPSQTWSSDEWFLSDSKRTFYPTAWKVYTSGRVHGQTIGGNVNTLFLLAGTPYQPDFEDKIILLEFSDDGETWLDFSRLLAQVLQLAKRPRALLLGRFPKTSQMTEQRLLYILDKFPILKEIPVMYDLDFGHTQPIFTIPLGQEVWLDTDELVIKV